MQHCVIALQFQEHYISIMCHHESLVDIQKVLEEQYSTLTKAEALVAAGDISLQGKPPVVMHDHHSFPANQTKAVAHETPKALVEYCLAVGATYLYAFEDKKWEGIPLTVVQDDGHYVA